VASMLDELQGRNGPAFSPDGRTIYVIGSRTRPHRLICAWDHDAGKLSNKRLTTRAGGPGALDGMAVDPLGNLRRGLRARGELGAQADVLDRARVFARGGRPLALSYLSERRAKVCFSGAKNNRLFMASTHWHFALYVNVRGAVA